MQMIIKNLIFDVPVNIDYVVLTSVVIEPLKLSAFDFVKLLDGTCVTSILCPWYYVTAKEVIRAYFNNLWFL